jgi:hypothetical protein
VIFSHSAKVLLGLVLVLTFLPKALPKSPLNDVQPRADRAAIDFLSRHGFEVRGEQRRLGLLIHASSGECQLRVLETDATGWNRDRVRHFATKADRIAFIFDGEIYSEQPIALTSLWHLWTRFRKKIGVPAPTKPVLAVAASQGCVLEKLPWAEIASAVRVTVAV